MRRHLVPLFLGAILVSACAGTYRASATVSSPDLVYVGPGVYAVAGYSDPVYYADNYYWRYDDGYWYRSNRYSGGWQYYSQPPGAIVRIDRPYTRYYRDHGRVHVDRRYYPSDRNRPVEIREYRGRRVDRRDHRR